MRAYSVIDKKKRGGKLSFEELDFFIGAYVEGRIPAYQMSALLMAIYFQGLSFGELVDLTKIIKDSGHVIEAGEYGFKLIDKHSTGGVGDTTTLIAVPLAAAGVKILKMSGRGLGYTGGTIDKLESIKGFSTELAREDIEALLARVGCVIISQSENLALADKKLYALRDVTATVDSKDLIASSIMGKKLASGCQGLVLDIKAGSGAFMQDYDKAESLAGLMLDLANKAGLDASAIISSMDQPLGRMVGNSLEVIEAIQVLRGEGSKDLTDLSVDLAAHMLVHGLDMDLSTSKSRVRSLLQEGRGLEKFCQMIEGQGGSLDFMNNLQDYIEASYSLDLVAWDSAFVRELKADKIGMAASLAGAARTRLEDGIDHTAGVILYKKIGVKVERGEPLARVQGSSLEKVKEGFTLLKKAYKLGDKPQDRALIYKEVL